MKDEIRIVIDDDAIMNYEKYYFDIHRKAKKKPIRHPYHESINTWMIMKRPAMNNLKQAWKSFIVWLVEYEGLDGMGIQNCELSFFTYYPTNRRHDVDNSVPKFIIDGFVEGGLIVDDDMKHIHRLTLECGIDSVRPRTEITIFYWDERTEKQDEKGECEDDRKGGGS